MLNHDADSRDIAVVEVLVQWSRLWDARSHQEQIKAAAEAAIGQYDAQLNDCRAALRVFGFDPSREDVWNHLSERYWPAVQRALSPPTPPPSGAPDHAPLIAEDAQGRDSGETMLPGKPKMPKIYKVVHERLRIAGADGTKAAPIREYIESTYGVQIHEKTVGMTLYRLLRKGHARREKHTWFFVPHDAETKNPGVGAPGSTSIDPT